MNTYTDPTTYPAPNTYPAPAARRSTSRIVAITSICAVGLTSLVAVAALALAGHNFATHSAATTRPAAAATAAAHHATAPVPSPAVATLQRQLGQLNYYEGPVDGLWGPMTSQAVTYLQRDAGLPQTGQLNAATDAALAHFLATGNSQMTAA